VTVRNVLPASNPLAAGLASRVTQLLHERETPFAIIYRANGPGGEELAVHVVHMPLIRLAPHPGRVLDALREYGRRSPSLHGAPLWSELLEDGRLCYALNWTESDAVSLTRTAVQTPNELAPAAGALCAQLSRWHAIDVIHGAITPDSLRIERQTGRMYLDDMAIFSALVLGGADARRIIELSPGLPYASPELVAGRGYDGRADVYALGTTVYELFTGRPPFGGRTTATMMASVLMEDTTISATDGGNRETIDVIAALLRAIEKSPDDRWSGARDFGNALTAQVLEAPKEKSTVVPRPGCGPVAIIVIAIATFLGTA